MSYANTWIKNIWGNLRKNANNNVWVLTGTGGPTNGTSGTAAKLAGPGSFYINISNGFVYVNENTLASPTWVLMNGASGNVTLDGVQTLTNKTLGVSNTLELLDTLFTLDDNADPTKQMVFQLSSITTATKRTITVPDADFTMVGLATSQTLTGKTLTAPVLNQPVTLHPVQSLAGLGTNQGNSALITLAASGIVFATAADGTVGIRLPVAVAGMRITVVNDVAANAIMKVYGNATDSATINGTAGSTAYAQVAKTTVDFISPATAKWQTLPILGS